ncbi:Adenylate and Guanylate cyclase catalytic domain containing protein [Tritrichomonas foetus]|uniref:Adenylate and Guanylate cyclase catalytic domain containing protein n=1 Tax=Tritrichomonas foetus TaxID=1144522 RepID=A0A1J4JY00_9EUKA|nr:Adenylate and Guanylate cyclase catalytic domain containing protein [Tritrichomonas foetus]|eukprot:OHT04039.1 Adenylate and Guanylate cyclase catalytic domain containing protein [Tritrichomonas foetus]
MKEYPLKKLDKSTKKFMHHDTHSTISNETTALQKLGFDNHIDTQRVFASILNRMRPSSMVLSIVMEVISFIQILSLGFVATVPGIIDGSTYTTFLATFFKGSMDISNCFSDKRQGNMILIIIYTCLLIIWLIFYLIYTTSYKGTKTFNPFVINVLYYLGYHGFKALSVVTATSIGYFMRFLYEDPNTVYAVLTFVSIAIFFSYIAIAFFMLRIIQSSPDVDIKNRFCFWPQNYVAPLYRIILGYVLPMLLEVLRGHGTIAQAISYVIVIGSGIAGFVIIWNSEFNVFPSGKVVLTTEYNILIVAPLLSIIYMFAGGDSLYYILTFIVIIVGVGCTLSYIAGRKTKTRIDLLYSKFENLTSNINNPKECITLIKVGIVFNAPCITNHTLLNWAISRWPNHQPLLFIVSFIFYVIHMPYREILDLVSVAVDISPFSVYDGLLFFQIFNRLPTHEHMLMRRIEGIKRLYDLPKSSLRLFWEAALAHQWDEVVVKCQNFHKDIEHINQIYQNLIFENPSSECVMQEFIKFAQDVEGNYLVAFAAQKELMSRKPAEDTPEAQAEGESMVAMSKLSSVKSSIFLSEFSENAQGFDKVQSGIQSALNARPVYWPTRFFISIVIICIISLSMVIVAFAMSNNESTRLDNQVTLAIRVHQMSLSLTQILYTAIEFTTHNMSQTVSGSKFDYMAYRSKLYELSNEFDELLATSFSLHASMPKSFLRLWVSEDVESYILSPVNATEQNLSLMSAVRIYQMRARTLAFSPEDYIGTIESPSPEILMISYLYSAVAEATNIMIESITEVASNEIKNSHINIILPIISGLCVNFLILIISCPITMLGIMREFDFFVSLYAAVPIKVVRRILHRENEVRKDLEAEQNDQNHLRNQKKSLPARLYHTYQIISVFIICFIITPIPVIVTLFAYANHANQSNFVLNGLKLSSEIISSFGHLCLYSFRLVTSFPTTMNEEKEMEEFMDSANNMINKYTELYFGGSDVIQDGLVRYIEAENPDKANETCTHLHGHGIIDHDCSEVHEDIFYLYGLAKRLHELGRVSEIGGVTSSWWRLFYPVAASNLNNGITQFYSIFSEIAKQQCEQNSLMNTVALAVGIIIFVLAIGLVLAFDKLYLDYQLRSLLKPILVMEPEQISESPFLLRFLQGDFDNPARQTNRESRKKNSNNSAPLFDFILEGVLIMTADGTVIASNKKYHELMANTADEVLGLNVTNIFNQTLQPLFDGLTKIKQGGAFQQNLSIETTLFTEDDRELQVKISLVAQLEPNERGNRSTTCAFIIADRSDLIKAQQQLRREKANVESLLDSILPHSIAVSLLNGQSEISFEVETACILFSDIVSFTPMCSKMTAKQIMNTLNLLFTEFDTELGKFKRVTKLKTIGDAYVCAAGIFENEGPIEDAACEIVSFAQRMQEIIPTLNHKHGTCIHMRIGVYAGGPLICGVLGKEKSLFEIIGNGVNIAEELEASGVHDKIHISQSVADLITPLAFKLTERGEGIKIAGLEDQKTWTVG